MMRFHILAAFVACLIAFFATRADAVQCGALKFPNGSAVDLKSFSGSFAGNLVQVNNGRFEGPYTWTISPCGTVCAGQPQSGQMAEAGGSGNNPCNLVMAAAAPPQVDPVSSKTIVMNLSGTDATWNVFWKVTMYLNCDPSATTLRVAGSYTITVDSINNEVAAVFNTFHQAFCAAAVPPPVPPRPRCGKVHFPNGTNVDLSSFDSVWSGPLVQINNGQNSGPYLWKISPCGIICLGQPVSGQMAEAGGSSNNPCNLVL
jgi:hypothetical protein